MSTPERPRDENERREIKTGAGLTAVINLDGAYLESLTDPNDMDLLFPAQLITIDGEEKLRGGIPICAPIFGKASKASQLNLPQHGFARNHRWEVIDDKDPAMIDLFLVVPKDGSEEFRQYPQYAGCAMRLRINLRTGEKDESILQMGLSILNGGEQPMVVAPGFHPYFPLGPNSDASEVTFSTGPKGGFSYEERFSPEELAATQILEPATPTAAFRITTETAAIKIFTETLRTPAVWTDNLEKYVCFEPTAAGPVAAGNEDLNQYMIAKDVQKNYGMKITWDYNSGE